MSVVLLVGVVSFALALAGSAELSEPSRRNPGSGVVRSSQGEKASREREQRRSTLFADVACLGDDLCEDGNPKEVSCGVEDDLNAEQCALVAAHASDIRDQSRTGHDVVGWG